MREICLIAAICCGIAWAQHVLGNIDTMIQEDKCNDIAINYATHNYKITDGPEKWHLDFQEDKLKCTSAIK